MNEKASDWFPQHRGVLQGSPLSPYLFNLFVDDLLELLNCSTSDGLPNGLFYADDGVILVGPGISAQILLDILLDWAKAKGMSLNVSKCGHVSQASNPQPLMVNDCQIPLVRSYRYLRFPMTARGVDFIMLLSQRTEAAEKRVKWLSMYADGWGPAHRLRIYKQFLSPMLEYGAPLVWAWVLENPAKNQKLFAEATAKWKQLMLWIAGPEKKKTTQCDRQSLWNNPVTCTVSASLISIPVDIGTGRTTICGMESNE